MSDKGLRGLDPGPRFGCPQNTPKHILVTYAKAPYIKDMADPYYSDDTITIYHGESLFVLPEISGVGAVVTDPPYSSGGAMRSDRTQATTAKYVQSGTSAYRPEFSGDNRDQRSYLTWSALWMAAARSACVASAPICCFTDWRQMPITTDAIQAGGWVWRGIAVWSKGFGRPMPGRFSSAAEYVVYGTNGPAPAHDKYPSGVFENPVPTDRLHIAQKPEAVMRWVLQVVPQGSVVLDPFMGSGTTLVAARDLGFKCIGIDCDERYCEIAAKRASQVSLFESAA